MMMRVYYAAFILIAAPIELILDFWSGLRGGDHRLLVRPISQALIYIYAFVLAVETLFRIAQHQDVLQQKRHLHLAVSGAIIVVAMFVVEYVGFLRPRIEAGETAESSWLGQVVVLFIGLAVSLMSYFSIEAGKRHLADVRLSPSDPTEAG